MSSPLSPRSNTVLMAPRYLLTLLFMDPYLFNETAEQSLPSLSPSLPHSHSSSIYFAFCMRLVTPRHLINRREVDYRLYESLCTTYLL